MKNKFFAFIYAMNYIAQAAWSFVFSGGLVFGVGYLFTRWLSLGRGALVVSVVLGALVGVYSMFRYIIRMASFVGGEDDGRRRRRASSQKNQKSTDETNEK